MARIEFDSWDFDYLTNDITDISNKIDNLRIFVANQFSEEKDNDLFVDGFNNSYKYLEDEKTRLDGNLKLIKDFKEATNNIEEVYIKEFDDVQIPVVAYREVVMRTISVEPEPIHVEPEPTVEPPPPAPEPAPQPAPQPQPQPAPAPAPVAVSNINNNTNNSSSSTDNSSSTSNNTNNTDLKDPTTETNTQTTDNTTTTGGSGNTGNQNASTVAEAVPTAEEPKANDKKKDDGTLQTIAAVAGAAAAVGLVGVGAAAAVKKHKEKEDEDEPESSYYGGE